MLLSRDGIDIDAVAIDLTGGGTVSGTGGGGGSARAGGGSIQITARGTLTIASTGSVEANGGEAMTVGGSYGGGGGGGRVAFCADDVWLAWSQGPEYTNHPPAVSIEGGIITQSQSSPQPGSRGTFYAATAPESLVLKLGTVIAVF